ncbi:hypothetical protein Bca4012_076210 [Brassica carinata]
MQQLTAASFNVSLVFLEDLAYSPILIEISLLDSRKGFYSKFWLQKLKKQCILISERAHVNNFSYATITVI